MKILQVVHYYLPRHQAGTELYTRALARQFRKHGHRVYIFTSEDRSGPGFKLEEDDYEGSPVFRLCHSEVGDFRSGYQRPEFDVLFGETLDRVKPDVVHFQHLFRLSTGFVQEAGKRRLPGIMTLADYWLVCPAIIMLKPENALCAGPDQGRSCVNCPHAFSAFASDQPGWFWKNLETGISYAHKLKRRLPPSLVDSARAALGKKQEYGKKLELINQRWMEMKKTADQLSLLISPSRFLMEMAVRSKIVAPEKIIFSDYGFETEGFAKAGQGPRQEGTLTLGFIGTLVGHKGAHVLIRAMKALPEAAVELKIFGEPKDFPGYVRSLKKLSGKDPRIKWMGRVEHDRVAEALGQIDILVAPSLWYENSPLTIHEAFMAGVPVIAGNIGGMKELVEEGGGLLFEPGNPADLADKINKIAANPARLSELRQTIPPVKSIEDNCQELMLIYQMLIKNA